MFYLCTILCRLDQCHESEVNFTLLMQDGSANDRKIAKLCEYAAKNPFRIPKVMNRALVSIKQQHLKFRGSF